MKPLLAAGVVLLSAGLTSPVHAHSGDSYQWEHRYVCVKIKKSVHKSWQVRRVIRVWNRSQNHVKLRSKKSCKGARQKIVVRTYARRDDRGGYVDWTHWYFPQIQGEDIHLKRGVVYLNRRYYRGKSPCVKSSLAAHEIGHALGLGHITTTRPDALMGKRRGVYHYNQWRCGKLGRQDIRLVNRTYTVT